MPLPLRGCLAARHACCSTCCPISICGCWRCCCYTFIATRRRCCRVWSHRRRCRCRRETWCTDWRCSTGVDCRCHVCLQRCSSAGWAVSQGTVKDVCTMAAGAVDHSLLVAVVPQRIAERLDVEVGHHCRLLLQLVALLHAAVERCREVELTPAEGRWSSLAKPSSDSWYQTVWYTGVLRVQRAAAADISNAPQAAHFSVGTMTMDVPMTETSSTGRQLTTSTAVKSAVPLQGCFGLAAYVLMRCCTTLVSACCSSRNCAASSRLHMVAVSMSMLSRRRQCCSRDRTASWWERFVLSSASPSMPAPLPLSGSRS